MRHLLLLAWSVALCAGAAFVRLGYPQRHSRLFSEVLAAESAHVIAHLGLYGTFAALLAVRSPPWRVLGLTLGLGVAQELVQVAGRREFGSPEWFDLAVDSAAATLVLVGCAIGRARRGHVTGMRPHEG